MYSQVKTVQQLKKRFESCLCSSPGKGTYTFTCCIVNLTSLKVALQIKHGTDAKLFLDYLMAMPIGIL